MRNLYFFIITLSLLCINQLSAQKLNFEDVRKVERIGAFTNAEKEVSGYYCFYESAKADNGKRVFQMALFDPDLQEISNKQMVEDKQVTITQGVSSGNSLMLLFANPKAKSWTLRQYNNAGIEQNTRTLSLAGMNPAYGKAPAHDLTALSGKGFLHYMTAPGFYSMRFYSDDSTSMKSWQFEQPCDAKNFDLEFLAANENQLFSAFTAYTAANRKDGQFSILAIDMKTGKRLFEKSMEDDRYAIQITNGLNCGDQICLFGLYYEKSKEVFAANSLGLCALKMDMNGDITSRQYLSWEQDISQLLPVNKEGKAINIGHFFFHEFIPLPDGNIIGIAESFRRNASALGIASTLLVGSGNLTKTIVEDLYVFEMTPDFNLRGIQQVEKPAESYEIETEFNRPQAVGRMLKNMGAFHYKFTQKGIDNSALMGFYMTATRGRDFDLGNFQYREHNFQTDKKLVTTSTLSLGVLPAKPGYVMLWEPGRKYLSIRLESIADK